MADPVAAARVPWIGAQWDLIDLQIDQRGGRLSSSLAENGTLRLRAGDHFRLAVLFFSGTNAINPAPSRLRWSLRDAANLELVAAVTLNTPVAATGQSQPYFLLEPNITRLEAAGRDLLDEGQGALPCVMDVDWTIGGDVYSSQTMPVVVEFGLTVQTGGTTPRDPDPPRPPDPPPPPDDPPPPDPPRPPDPPPPPDDPPPDKVPDGLRLGDMLYWNGFAWVLLAAPSSNDLRVLTIQSGNLVWAPTEECP